MSTYTYVASVLRCPAVVPSWYPTGPITPRLLTAAAGRLLNDATGIAYRDLTSGEAPPESQPGFRLYADLSVLTNGVSVALQARR